jgi:hypothetical protein
MRDTFAKWFILCMRIALLIVPIWILVPPGMNQLLLTAVSILIFCFFSLMLWGAQIGPIEVQVIINTTAYVPTSQPLWEYPTDSLDMLPSWWYICN